MSRNIYDCFIFYNELEMLQLRLSELYESVDFFVICEAPFNFRGKEKPLYFSENKRIFEKYLDKIIHVVVEDMPVPKGLPEGNSLLERDPAIWNMEYFQRNSIRRGLVNANPDDVIVISDCDELLKKATIQRLRENEGYFLIDLAMYQFFLNMQERESGWDKVFAFSFYLGDLIPDFNVIRRNPLEFFNSFAGPKLRLDGGGWHFTFLGGRDRVKNKLSSYSHTDGWQRRMWDDDLLSKQMIELRDVGGGKH